MMAEDLALKTSHKAEELFSDPTDATRNENSLNSTDKPPDSEKMQETEEEQVPPVSVPVPTAPVSPHPATGIKWVMILVSIYTLGFLYGLDNTIVADIQGAVVSEFNDVQQLPWMGSAFPLGGIATILPIGKAFAVFDNKWMYNGSTLLFLIGSAICGAAPNMNALIVGRVVAGIGAGGTYLGLLNLLSRFTTIRERPGFMALTGLIWGSGTILGPVIGGAFADSSATWRWAFYINLVIIGAVSPALIFIIPSVQPQPSIPFLQKLRELDWLGSLLNAGIYTAWVIALQFGGTRWAWDDGRTIATFVVVGVLVILFVAQQYFSFLTTPERRIFPTMFLNRRTMLLLFFLTACVTTAIFVPVFYVPVYFEFVHGDSGVQSSVRLLPLVITLVVVLLIKGYAMPRLGLYMPYYAVGMVLILVGGALMYTVSTTTSASAIYGYTSLIAIGGGLATNAAYSIAPAKLLVPSPKSKLPPQPHLIPASIAWINVAQIGAIMHSLAISGAVFQNLAFQYLKNVFDAAGLGLSDEDIRSAVGGARSAVFETLTPKAKADAVDAIVKAISRVYILVLAAGAFGVVCSLGLRRERLFAKKPKDSKA